MKLVVVINYTQWTNIKLCMSQLRSIYLYTYMKYRKLQYMRANKQWLVYLGKICYPGSLTFTSFGNTISSFPFACCCFVVSANLPFPAIY